MEKGLRLTYVVAGLIVCGIITMTVLMPAVIARHYDNAMLGAITVEKKDADVAGYKYNLSTDEKLYVLSNALNNRVLPQSDYFAAIHWQDSISDIQTQSYAFQPVYKDSEYNSQTCADALKALQTELQLLNKQGILPALDFDPHSNKYETNLFSAIDILEPKENVKVWQISFSGPIIRDGLVDCIMDAETHKLYSVSIRAAKTWKQYDADKVAQLWAAYLGSSAPKPYTPDSPLIEDATDYKKYAINGVGSDKTIVTIGYYEGVHEFFIKIAK